MRPGVSQKVSRDGMSPGNERGNPRYSLASAAVNEEKDKALLFVGMLAILNKRRCFYFAESSNQKACLWCAFDRPGRGAEIIFKHPGFHVWRAYQRYQFFCQHRHVCGHRPRAGLRCYCRGSYGYFVHHYPPNGSLYAPIYAYQCAYGHSACAVFPKTAPPYFLENAAFCGNRAACMLFLFQYAHPHHDGHAEQRRLVSLHQRLFADSCAFGADLRAFKIHKEIPCSRPCPASAPAK